MAFRYRFCDLIGYDVRYVLRLIQDVHNYTPVPHSDASYAAARALPVIDA